MDAELVAHADRADDLMSRFGRSPWFHHNRSGGNIQTAHMKNRKSTKPTVGVGKDFDQSP
ncbi:hypothetical protein RESH_01208 [Rhodopirellula europaea SH398]|uniref:Uncharacterized protein n=1 Tax=Rhodopirellula europaea SH398 TaxID=1263868 RepID=M5SKI7_9BACT|nr:hypothetical protein RESH_01208 [Rhodopirellula europaea SH398]